MNKLISKNPVQRFKQGRKIEKFYGGGFSRKSSGRTSNEQAAYIFKKIFSPEKWFSIKPTGGGLLGWINRTPTVDTVTKQNTVSTPKDYSFMTKGTLAPESEQSKKEREDYFNKQKQKYNFVSTPSKKQTNIPVNNIWLKGYKHDEVKDVKAMQNELIRLGLLNDKFGADGKWGDNTETAYQKYLNLKNIPVYEKPETPSVAAMAGIYSEENKPLYQRIRFKQGGQLPSRNIVERFKRNFRLVAQ